MFVPFSIQVYSQVFYWIVEWYQTWYIMVVRPVMTIAFTCIQFCKTLKWGLFKTPKPVFFLNEIRNTKATNIFCYLHLLQQSQHRIILSQSNCCMHMHIVHSSSFYGYELGHRHLRLLSALPRPSRGKQKPVHYHLLGIYARDGFDVIFVEILTL